MERYRLGKSDLEVAPVILGAWAFGSAQWGNQPEDSVHIATINAALDSGINMIDTAAGYGRSEEIVGKAIGDGETKCSSRRNAPAIATQCAGRWRTPFGRWASMQSICVSSTGLMPRSPPRKTLPPLRKCARKANQVPWHIQLQHSRSQRSAVHSQNRCDPALLWHTLESNRPRRAPRLVHRKRRSDHAVLTAGTGASDRQVQQRRPSAYRLSADKTCCSSPGGSRNA